ncbi:MAG TPA: SDR family oxidoreductase [Polyangiales bacterium]
MTQVFTEGTLKGRSALITGGGGDICGGIAERLAHAGAKVALLGRRLEKLELVAERIRARGQEAVSVAADVRDYDKVESAVKEAATRLGQLDIVINGAAGNFLAPAASLSANGFRTVIDIDLCGTFNVSRAAFSFLQQTRGSIVNITATQALIATPLQCHAGAAKAGIEKLTRDLALEWGPLGIRVNTVAPGPIGDTEGMARLAPEGHEKLQRYVPLRRYGKIEEVAEAVLFLVSPAAGFITGSTLLIDGGLSLMGSGGTMMGQG